MENIAQKKQPSAGVGILKTFAFFAVLLGLGWFLLTSLIGGGSPKPTPKPKYQTITIDRLSKYDYYTPLPGEKPDPELLAKNKIPDEIRNLSGKQVAIAGYMLPIDVDDKGNVSDFAMNGNYDMCYYGAPTSINQWVVVKMSPDQKTRYTHTPVTVYGTLEVGEEIKDGEVVSLYRMQADSVSGGK